MYLVPGLGRWKKFYISNGPGKNITEINQYKVSTNKAIPSDCGNEIFVLCHIPEAIEIMKPDVAKYSPMVYQLELKKKIINGLNNVSEEKVTIGNAL